MSKFKTLEEAQKAYDALQAQHTAAQKENAALKNNLADATKVVEELNGKLDAAKDANPGEVIAVVGKQKYRVNFGVMGKKKSDVANDQSLLKELIAKGSGAITAVS